MECSLKSVFVWLNLFQKALCEYFQNLKKNKPHLVFVICRLQFRYGDVWAPVRGKSTQNYPHLTEDEVYLGRSEFIKSVWSYSADIMDIIVFRNQSDIQVVPRYHDGRLVNITHSALLYVSGTFGEWGGAHLFCDLTLHYL